MSEILFLADLVFEKFEGLKLLEILEFPDFESFLDHVLEGGHFLKTVNDVHQVVP